MHQLTHRKATINDLRTIESFEFQATHEGMKLYLD